MTSKDTPPEKPTPPVTVARPRGTRRHLKAALLIGVWVTAVRWSEDFMSVACLLIFAAVSPLYAWLPESNHRAAYEQVEYAQGYSEETFWALEKGIPESEALHRLGAPLAEDAGHPSIDWLYVDGSCASFVEFGSPPYMGCYTLVRFDPSHRIKSCSGSFDDPFGPLSPAETPRGSYLCISKMESRWLCSKGTTLSEFEEIYGPPHAKRIDLAVRWLDYADSPHPKLAFVRRVGIDADGRVCGLDGSDYWLPD